MLKDYMADVLAVELAECLLKDKLKEQFRKKKFAVEYEQPTIDEKPGLFMGVLWLVPTALLIIVMIYVAWFAILLFRWNWLLGGMLALGCGFALLLMFGGVGWFMTKFLDSLEEYRSDVRSYQYSIESYERNMESWRSFKNSIPRIEEKIEMIQRDLEAVEQESKHLYSFNYIPSGYRNPWAVHFFYEWFNSCQSEDMNYAITRYEDKKSYEDIWYQYNRYDTLKELMWLDSETIRFLKGLKSLK